MEPNAILKLASQAYTASGNSGQIGVSAYRELAVDLDITVISGSGASATFAFDRLGADGVWYVAWTSSAQTATGTVSASIGSGMAVAQSFGLTGRLRWTIAGTTPSVTFSASILAK